LPTMPEEHKTWLDLLEPLIGELQVRLRGLKPREVAYRSGADFVARGDQAPGITLRLWDRPYNVRWPEIEACEGGAESPCRADIASLILFYLVTADGTPKAGRWISFRELPDGLFYHQAFQGYTGRRLAQHFGNDLAAFQQAARAAGGFSLSLGDASFSFRALPRVELAAVYWLGDEDIPANATILFDAAACHYLSTDGLAHLGSQLIGRLIAHSQTEGYERDPH
jgi:hypothetical protein